MTKSKLNRLAFGLMGLLDIPLDTDTLMIAPLIIGIAVDDTIHFITHYRMALAKHSDMRMALIACGLPIQDWKGRELGFTRQMEKVADECGGLRRLGVASLDMAYVAAGRYDAYWEQGLNSWDMCAGALMVREAGGFISDAYGKDEILALLDEAS